MNDVLVVSSKELVELRNGATIVGIRRNGGNYRIGKVVDVSDDRDNTVKGVVVKCSKTLTDDDLIAWTLDIKLKD